MSVPMNANELRSSFLKYFEQRDLFWILAKPNAPATP